MQNIKKSHWFQFSEKLAPEIYATYRLSDIMSSRENRFQTQIWVTMNQF